MLLFPLKQFTYKIMAPQKNKTIMKNIKGTLFTLKVTLNLNK